MRPLALLLMTLALTFSGSAHAEGEGTSAGYSVTCSASLSGGGCWVERPTFVWGPVELAFGFDARASWGAWERSYAAPYGILGWYENNWSAWLEFHLPETGMPLVGKPDPFRFGVTWRY
jgi:hypothetical protein